MTGSDPTTLGVIPSFTFTGSLIESTPYVPTLTGSQLGVPGNNQIAGETPASASNDAVAYGKSKAGAPPAQQPVLWLFILMLAGVFVLAHIAHLSFRSP